MSAPWEALAARARGLTTHLLDAERLRELRRAPDGRGVQRLLRETAYAPFLPAHDTAPQALDRAVTRCAADRLARLARWAGQDPRSLSALFLELDAHSVRAVLRGIAGTTGAERRLAAALPTPALDRRALETLARADSAGSVAATLAVWGHPYGPPLLDEARRARPDPFRLELALSRAYAASAGAAARRHGGRDLRAFVAESIASGNLVTALLLAGVRTESPLDAFYVEGAERPTREEFVRAASAESREACADLLAAAAPAWVFGTALAARRTSPVALSRALLDGRARRLERERRERPLSAVAVLLFFLAQQREADAVRRAVWAASLPSGEAR